MASARSPASGPVVLRSRHTRRAILASSSTVLNSLLGTAGWPPQAIPLLFRNDLELNMVRDDRASRVAPCQHVRLELSGAYSAHAPCSFFSHDLLSVAKQTFLPCYSELTGRALYVVQVSGLISVATGVIGRVRGRRR